MQILNPTHTKRLFQLALPVMVTQVGQVTVQLFDNIMVGKLLGADALASVSLANGVFFSIFVLALGFSLAIPPLVSEAQSQNDHTRINRIFRHGFVLNMSIGLALVIIMLLALPILYHLDQPAKIIPDTESYLRISIISILPFMVFQTMREVSEGLSFTIGVTKATIIANVINIFLNYVFIKGLFGIESMGVDGSAYASFIARVFMAVFLFFVMKKHPTTKRYMNDFSLKAKLFQKSMFQKLIKLGVPTALQMFFEITAFAAAAFICGLVSATDIAAHQIALSLASFTFNLCIGFSIATTIMTGNRFGEKNYAALREVGINNLKIVFLFMVFCGIIFILGRNILPTFFTQPGDLEVIHLASSLIIIAALFQLSDGLQVLSLGALRGMQDVKIPSIITFIAYWIITIPLGYYLCVKMELGAYGMWIALGIGLTISAFLLIMRFLKLSKKNLI
ncbi:MATE family efflux transporter [Frigoriflavimonas asaccharolytica]|uniref:Multidrug-efflux transporter n=1 Tax=Frigoriflavimonas asaccharolytica TaxID=2735899 RepID=A0A8J8G4V5_9FLAO|nr:MATE family efflux transporter [Frigoriflavimonas asaccharolytica]NRS91483.1 MATE family multidrug resistance protein [Frigoriflavimonas asaccharolytica]